MLTRFKEAETKRISIKERIDNICEQYRVFRRDSFQAHSDFAKEIKRLKKSISHLQKLVPGPGKCRCTIEKDEENHVDPPEAK